MRTILVVANRMLAMAVAALSLSVQAIEVDDAPMPVLAAIPVAERVWFNEPDLWPGTFVSTTRPEQLEYG